MSRTYRTPWNQIPHADRVAMAGGGRAGFNARVKHGMEKPTRGYDFASGWQTVGKPRCRRKRRG